MLESECPMKPPSYGESIQVAGGVARGGTSGTYNLRACLRISEFTLTRNFLDYDPEMPVGISSKEGFVAAVITSPAGKVIAGEENPSTPSHGVLNIDYECSDKQTLLKIYDCLHLKQLENTAVQHTISNFFYDSSIKSFRHDENNNAYFMEILVENPSFSAMRGLYGAFDCKPSLNHAYSLYVNYPQRDYPLLANDFFPVTRQNPVSALLVKGGQRLSYEILSKKKCTIWFTVVFSADNVEQLNVIKNFLVDPKFCGDARGFEISDSMLYVTTPKRPDFLNYYRIDDPWKMFGDYESCSYELNRVMKFHCGSGALNTGPPHTLLCYSESIARRFGKIMDYLLG